MFNRTNIIALAAILLLFFTGCHNNSRRPLPLDDDTISLSGVALSRVGLPKSGELSKQLGKNGDVDLNGNALTGDPIDGLFAVLLSNGVQLDRDEITNSDFGLKFDIDSIKETDCLLVRVEQADLTVVAEVKLPPLFLSSGQKITLNLELRPAVTDPQNGALQGLVAFLAFKNDVDVVIDNAVDRDGDGTPDAPGGRKSYGDNLIQFEFNFDGVFGRQDDIVFFGILPSIFDANINDGYSNDVNDRDLSAVNGDPEVAVKNLTVEYIPTHKIIGDTGSSFSSQFRVCIFRKAPVSLEGVDITIITEAGDIDGNGVGPFIVTIDPDDPRVEFTADGTVYMYLTHTFNAGTTGKVRTTATSGLGKTSSQTISLSTPGAGNANPPTVTNANPGNGPAAGGTAVTVTGTDFQDGATVYFDGVPASAIVFTNSTTLTCTTPMGTPGNVDVHVINPDSQFGTLDNGYLYDAPPTITNLNPADGPTGGGTNITITGTNFADPMEVRFGLTMATNIVVNSGTELTCDTPVGPGEGLVGVTVTNPSEGTAISMDAFTYLDTPTVTLIAPDAGPSGGGMNVTITGTNFTSTNTTVDIGGNPATNVVVVSDTSITCTTPVGAQGAANVDVNTPGGSGQLSNGFQYFDAPTVTNINPNNGTTLGGTGVTITGTNFNNGSSSTGVTATVGGQTLTNLNVVNATTITGNTVAQGAGNVDVVVTTPGGNDTLVGGFEYIAPPVVIGVTPAEGPTTGNTSVTITGSSFRTGPQVFFDANMAANIVFVNATTITCDTPANGAGLANLRVINNDLQEDTLLNAFLFVGPPTVTNITPDVGPIGGGTAVTITGTGFSLGTMTTASISGQALTSLTIVNDTTITGNTPAIAAGNRTVLVTTTGGFDTLPSAFEYLDPPTVTNTNPAVGPDGGGTNVTLTGTNFYAPDTQVFFDGVVATNVNVTNATTLTCDTPAHIPAVVNVQVITPGGNDTDINSFEYLLAPNITNINPAAGPTAGSTAITITGANFVNPVTVTVGGNPATSIVVVSSTSITCDTPAGVNGARDVVVTNPDLQTGTSVGGFTYQAAPTISNVNPAFGSTAGSTSVTITGTNFFAGLTSVTFDASNGTNVNVTSSTSLTVDTPAHIEAMVDVVVTAPGGMVTSINGYEYFDSPTVTNVTANEGPTGGGTGVTVTGTNFQGQGTNTVRFDGSSATAVVVVNDTTITCNTPAHAAALVDVTVTNNGGLGTGTNDFEYVSAPTITNVNASQGPVAGGTGVTITGTNFRAGGAGTGVTFDGSNATGITVVNSTTITCNTPAHAAAFVNVVVTTAGGNDTLINGFQYIDPPTVTNVNPGTGSILGSTSVTVTGTNFVASNTTITFDGTSATSVNVTTSTSLTCNTPAGAEGMVNVVLTTPGGNDTLVNGFEYINDVDITNPTLSNLTLNEIDPRLNGMGSAGGTIQTGESGFTIDFTVADEMGGSGIDHTSVFVTSNTTTTGAGGMAAGQNLFASLQNTTEYDVDGNPNRVPFGSMTGMETVTGVHVTIPSTVVFPTSSNTNITVRISDKSTNNSPTDVFNCDVITRTNANRPFEQNVIWLIRFDRDLWTLDVVFDGGGTATVNGFDGGGAGEDPDGGTANGINTGGGDNGIDDFIEDLYMHGLISDPDIGGNNNTAVPGTGKSIEVIIVEIMRDTIIDKLQNQWYAGVNNVDFRQDNAGLGVWDTSVSIPIFTGINYSQISCGGRARTADGNGGSAGTAFFDGDIFAGTDNPNSFHYNDFNHSGAPVALLGQFPTAVFAANVNSGGAFRPDFDPLLNSAARHGGAPPQGGGPVGDIGSDDLRVLQLYEDHTSTNFAAGEIDDARTAVFRNAIDHLCNNISKTLAHECGHSMSLVANNAISNGLFGNMSADFPSSSNHHIRLNTVGPPPNGGALFDTSNSGSINIMAPGSFFIQASDPNSGFGSHIRAYLKEQLIINTSE